MEVKTNFIKVSLFFKTNYESSFVENKNTAISSLQSNSLWDNSFKKKLKTQTEKKVNKVF